MASMARVTAVQARWTSLAPRERSGVLLAVWLVGLALAWAVLLAPALRVLQKAPARHALLDADMERMLRLQMRARVLQSQTAVSAPEALKALQASAAQLGKGASVRVLGDRVTLTLQQVSAADFAQWLAQPGAAFPLQPVEMHVQRGGGDAPGWSGTLTFALAQGGDAAR